jgi:hypothetical protein
MEQRKCQNSFYVLFGWGKIPLKGWCNGNKYIVFIHFIT